VSRAARHAWLFVLMLTGCGSPLQERFYTLRSNGSPVPAASDLSYRVAVGPVTVPAVVDRPQIVLRVGANRVTLQEQSRWAEPLKESIPRVIAINLAVLLGDAQVATDSQGAADAAEYRVVLDIQRFESVLGEAATLEVLWTVIVVKGGAATAGRFLLREPAGGPDDDAIVAAHDRALAALSRELAAAIRTARQHRNISSPPVSKRYPPAPIQQRSRVELANKSGNGR
jgi:uncharacterized lipoprotein YmbA